MCLMVAAANDCFHKYYEKNNITRFNVTALFECLAVRVDLLCRDGNAIVICVYRPPHTSKSQMDPFFLTFD